MNNKDAIEANTHIITYQTEIGTTTDIRYIYLTIVFALTFSCKVIKIDPNIITWKVRGQYHRLSACTTY